MKVSISYRLHKRGVTDTKGTRIVKPAQPFVAITKPSFGDGVWRPAVWLQQEVCHLLAEGGNYTARALRWLQREEKLAALKQEVKIKWSSLYEALLRPCAITVIHEFEAVRSVGALALTVLL